MHKIFKIYFMIITMNYTLNDHINQFLHPLLLLLFSNRKIFAILQSLTSLAVRRVF